MNFKAYAITRNIVKYLHTCAYQSHKLKVKQYRRYIICTSNWCTCVTAVEDSIV